LEEGREKDAELLQLKLLDAGAKLADFVNSRIKR
jgi:hypothetical protein